MEKNEAFKTYSDLQQKILNKSMHLVSAFKIKK